MKKITFFIIGLMMACVPLAMHADYIEAGFYRVHCKLSSRYVSVVGEEYSASQSSDAFWKCIRMRSGYAGYRSYDTNDSVHITDPATIIYIPNIGSSCKLYAQGTSTYSITGMTFKIAASSTVYQGRKTYLASIMVLFARCYLQDYCGFDIGKEETDNGRWFLEPLTADSINDYYFAADPLSTPDADGYYWATLCCDYNFEIPEGSGVIDAYKVTADNIKVADDGSYYLDTENLTSCVSGTTMNSSGVPVLIKCKYPYPSWNKLVPTGDVGNKTSFPLENGILKGNYFGSFLNNSNTGSWKEYTTYVSNNATKMDANYRTLGIDANGKLAFVTDTITYMPQNKAVLDVSSITNTPAEVLIGKPMSYTYTTLADALAGKEDSLYHISDNLIVVVATDADNSLWCTDGQDHWVKVAAGDYYASIKEFGSLAGKSIHGTMSDLTTNPVLTLTEAPTESTETPTEPTLVEYNLATNIAAVQADEVAYFQGYYFVENGTPKLRGYSGTNPNHRGQSLVLDLSKYVSDANLTPGSFYSIKSILQLNEAWETSDSAPRRVSKDDGDSYFTNYTAYAIEVPNPITTGVDEAAIERQPVAVTYVNALGQASTTPWTGINIVVTRYSDGSMQSTKSVKF